MTLNSIMEFGKYRGEAFGSIPDEYFKWLWDNNKGDSELRNWIEYNFNFDEDE